MRKDLSIHINRDDNKLLQPTSNERECGWLATDHVTDPHRLADATTPLSFLDGQSALPKLIVDEGEEACFRFVEFFAARIRNPGTRRAYYRNAMRFCRWLETHYVTLIETTSIHVAAYIESLVQQDYSKPTIKQHLATIRELFDWLVVGQIVPNNPAAPVRGPKHVVDRGTTPVLGAEDATRLLASIDVSHVVGARDRAIIATMIYTFGRIHAVLNMDIGDYVSLGSKRSVRLCEKNGNVITIPAHHQLVESLDAYIRTAGGNDAFPIQIGRLPHSSAHRPLFRTTVGVSRRLTNRRMSQSDAWRMIQRRARAAGITSSIGNHTFRATGITNFLQNGGRMEDAQNLAGHRSPRTTKLYDRRDEDVTAQEIERIRIGVDRQPRTD